MNRKKWVLISQKKNLSSNIDGVGMETKANRRM